METTTRVDAFWGDDYRGKHGEQMSCGWGATHAHTFKYRILEDTWNHCIENTGNKTETAAEQLTLNFNIHQVHCCTSGHGESHASIWAKLSCCTDWQPFAALHRHVYSVWTGKGIVFALALAHTSHKIFKIMEHGNNWMTIDYIHTWSLNDLYFWWSNPPKQGLFQ